MNKGQISLVATVIGTSGMLLASVFTSWATASNRTSTIDTKIQVVEKTEALHYLELRKDLARIEDKLDKILKEQ